MLFTTTTPESQWIISPANQSLEDVRLLFPTAQVATNPPPANVRWILHFPSWEHPLDLEDVDPSQVDRVVFGRPSAFENALIDDGWSALKTLEAQVIAFPALYPTLRRSLFAFVDRCIQRNTDPMRIAGLTYTVGIIHSHMGVYSSAKTYMCAAHEQYLRIVGPNHADVLHLETSLGCVYTVLKEWDNAEKMLDHAYEVRRTTLGNHHPATITTLMQRGILEHHQQKFKEAIIYLRACLQLCEEFKPTAIHSCKTNLAISLIAVEKFAEAKTLLQQCDPDTTTLDGCTRAHYLGVIATEEREFDVAIEWLSKVLAFRKACYGDHHPAVLNTMSVLAFTYDQREDTMAKAVQGYKECVESSEKIYGSAHPMTLGFLFNFALACEREPSHKWRPQAIQSYRLCYDERCKLLGTEHDDTITTLSGLVDVLLDEKKYEEVWPLLQTLHRVLKQRYGRNTPKQNLQLKT